MQSCFIRNDAVKKPLTPTYDGPYSVLSRNNKVFKVQLPNRQVNISIERLKPAYIIVESQTNDLSTNDNECQNANAKSKVDNKFVTCTTRSGRVVKPPVRFL